MESWWYLTDALHLTKRFRDIFGTLPPGSSTLHRPQTSSNGSGVFILCKSLGRSRSSAPLHAHTRTIQEFGGGRPHDSPFRGGRVSFGRGLSPLQSLAQPRVRTCSA